MVVAIDTGTGNPDNQFGTLLGVCNCLGQSLSTCNIGVAVGLLGKGARCQGDHHHIKALTQNSGQFIGIGDISGDWHYIVGQALGVAPQTKALEPDAGCRTLGNITTTGK